LINVKTPSQRAAKSRIYDLELILVVVTPE
jgi:hypothetical protein